MEVLICALNMGARLTTPVLGSVSLAMGYFFFRRELIAQSRAWLSPRGAEGESHVAASKQPHPATPRHATPRLHPLPPRGALGTRY